MNDHALAVDVADFQVRHLRTTCAGGIKCHEQDAMKRHLCGIDQTCDLLRAEYLRQVQHLLWIRCLGYTPASLQDLDIEEPQRRQPLNHRVGSQLPLAEHCCLILANMFWTELIRGTVEVSGVVLDCSNVSVDVCLGVVVSLQFLKHDLTQMGHRDILLLCDTPYLNATAARSATRASVRR